MALLVLIVLGATLGWLASILARTEAPGTILRADAKQGLWVRTADGALRLARMQAPGGKPMNDCDYLRGHQLEAGTQIAPEETHAE